MLPYRIIDPSFFQFYEKRNILSFLHFKHNNNNNMENYKPIFMISLAIVCAVILLSSFTFRLKQTAPVVSSLINASSSSAIPSTTAPTPTPISTSFSLLDSHLPTIANNLLLPNFIEHLVNFLNTYTSFQIVGDSTARQWYTTFVALQKGLIELDVITLNPSNNQYEIKQLPQDSEVS